jgi:hypothetical protein
MLVEGQSEEAFVKQTLSPWLATHRVFVQGPVVLWTKRLPAGGGHRGGVGSWWQIRKNLQALLADGDAWVTTLLDFYGLPKDAPGWAARKGHLTGHEQVLGMQSEISAALGHPPRFVPFLALHEFEAWMFAAPSVVAAHFGDPAVASKLEAEIPIAGGPEAINQGPSSHPKARLRQHCPSYKETSDGPTLLSKIGMPVVRVACPHFGAWLARLEALGELI